MMDQVDCMVFSDQLEALVKGRLPRDVGHHLRAHAAECPSCAEVLRVKEHLDLPSLAELEARVPDEMVSGMYPRVRARLETSPTAAAVRTGAAQGAGSTRFHRPALVPLLAAASLVLLFTTGILSIRLEASGDRADRLALELEAQRDRVTSLVSGGTTDPTSTAASGSLLLPPLTRRETITVAELREILDRLPSDRLVLSEARLREIGGLPLSRVGRLVREVLDGRALGNGLRAGDLLDALDDASLRPGLTFRTTELVDLLS